MNKLKVSMKPIIKYFRELSIVVIGVTITVSIGLWINNNNIRKDQKQYIGAIILELKENAETFDTYAKKLQTCVRYSNYLHSIDEKSKLNFDSINYYAYSGSDRIGWGNAISVTLYTEDAFEMFKFSGAMRHVDDKELLLSIWKVYYQMKSTQNYINECIQNKHEQLRDDRQADRNGKQIVVRAETFYINDNPYFMKFSCESTAKYVREIVSELENRK